MFRLSGVKLYFSSGIASAASTTSFSTMLISWSMTEGTVGGGCGDACAEGEADAAGLLFGVCAIATVAMTVIPTRSGMIEDAFMWRGWLWLVKRIYGD